MANRGINKVKNWPLEEISEIDENLARLMKKEKENPKITYIEKERGAMIIDPTDIRRRIQKYYEQIYVIRFDNLDIMNKFFLKPSLLK